MLFMPHQEKLWDCWMFFEENVYYLFYLRISEHGSWWDGVSLATSADLIHWTERGPVLEKSARAKWLGTGMVCKIGTRFIMNFSEEYPDKQQKVFFAESNDLLSWRRLEPVCEPDGLFYLGDATKSSNPYPRWDSLGIFTDVQNGRTDYYAFVTASFQNDLKPGRNGTLALLKSGDGLHWQCLKSPLAVQGEYPNYEVPEHLEMNGHHFALFSTNSKAGFRYDVATASGHTGGTYYLVSDQELAGYRRPLYNNRLIGQSDTYNVTANYVGRTLRVGDATLFYHIWGDQFVNGAFGTVKQILEVRPYELAVKYLKTNDSMIGDDLLGRLSVDRFNLQKKINDLPPVKWSVNRGIVSFEDVGSSGAITVPLAVPKHTSILSDGRFIRCNVRVDDGIGAGLVIGDEDALYSVFLNVVADRIEFSWLETGWEANTVQNILQTCRYRFEFHKNVSVCLIYRSCFLEIYVDDFYAMGVRTSKPIGGSRSGFYTETSSCEFSSWRVNAII